MMQDWQKEQLKVATGVSQPAKQWVGLTEKEIEMASHDYTEQEGFLHGCRWAQDQLKEKNT